MNAPAAHLRMLLVEDEEQLRSALSRALSVQYSVTAVPSAEAAVMEVRRDSFDAILSDVKLCGMDGLELLRRIREADLDVPFILMTGDPTLETAMRAVEHGAARYLRKPVDLSELRHVLSKAMTMHRLAKARRFAQEEIGQPGHGAADRAGLLTVVDNALSSLRLAWQPIVCWSRRRVVGYEALMRSAVLKPEAFIDAADRAGRTMDLSRTIRDLVSRAAETAPVTDLFVNINPPDLLDESLYDPAAPLSSLASRVVLEITERVSLEGIPELRNRLQRLRKLGYRIALDDLGSGYAGLTSFALLEPEMVKIDMALVRDVHRSATRRCLIASILAACRDLHCAAIAESVELPAERDALAELGCDMFQGYLFARPGFAFPEPQW